MYVESFKNNGFDYLRLVESKRVLNSKGVKTARKHVILNIGPLSKFDDGKPMYMERLKQSFKSGNPIIPSLKPYCDSSSAPTRVCHFIEKKFNFLQVNTCFFLCLSI